MEPDPGRGSEPGIQLRDYQSSAVHALRERWCTGGRRAWLVLPPGAGKTLVGLTAAGELGQRTVVFVPNTAIQGQWVNQARALGRTAGTDRELGNDITVLTYQSLAVFDPDVETDEEGRDRAAGPGKGDGRRLLDRLHDNGRELVRRLRQADPLTLVLDECHHLMDVWGRLLQAVLDELDDEYVIGLTGTPPTSLTRRETELVAELFGEPITGASVPALVRKGHLAPFAELAWLCEPDGNERDYIDAEAERFTELVTDALSPGFASTDFLPWLDSRFTAEAWPHLLRQEPRLTDAALRFRYAGLLSLPPVARAREEHERAPHAEDWIEVLSDYVRGCLLPNEERAALAAIRKALPSIGYTLTRTGIRRGSSPVDRVLARSAAKTAAAVEIASLEAAELGDRLRCLVLCDHERASATLPARLHGVLSAEAGSAHLMLARMVADPRTVDLEPMLVTGRTLAAGPRTARRFATWATEHGLAPAGLEVHEQDGIATLEGSWTTRRWVLAATEFFVRGHSRVLIGTRALLGEGWDAPAVNVLIDGTTATTATAVVQVRGRVLRLDPDWPEKIAHTWTLVCATEQHPKGGADWDRFVRKHRGYLALRPDGQVMAGVEHVHPEFSRYAAPERDTFGRLNSDMIARARDRAKTAADWRLGATSRDELVHTLLIRYRRTGGSRAFIETFEWGVPPPVRPELVTSRSLATPLPSASTRIWPIASFGAGAVAAASTALASGEISLVPLGLTGILGITSATLASRRRKRLYQYRRMLHDLANTPALAHLAYAIADALAQAGLTTRGADGVRGEYRADHGIQLALVGDSAQASKIFTAALDDVLSPLASPRYVIPRYVLDPRRIDDTLVNAWLDGSALAHAVGYHAVPEVFGNRKLRGIFARAWKTWISEGEPISTRTPEGAGILAAHGGSSPLDVTAASRLAWE